MQLNPAGQMVQSVWDAVPKNYPRVDTDHFIVMPNHIHGVIVLVGAGPRACPEFGGQPQGVAPTMSLPDLVHRFKSLTTKHYITGVEKFGWTRFPGRLWQRNYFEHVVRNEDSLDRIRQYIIDNPAQWEIDRENPAAVNLEPELAWLQ